MESKETTAYYQANFQATRGRLCSVVAQSEPSTTYPTHPGSQPTALRLSKADFTGFWTRGQIAAARPGCSSATFTAQCTIFAQSAKSPVTRLCMLRPSTRLRLNNSPRVDEDTCSPKPAVGVHPGPPRALTCPLLSRSVSRPLAPVSCAVELAWSGMASSNIVARLAPPLAPPSASRARVGGPVGMLAPVQLLPALLV